MSSNLDGLYRGIDLAVYTDIKHIGSVAIHGYNVGLL